MKLQDAKRTAADAGLEVRHDMLGWYVCTIEEGEFEDKGNASVGFDGRAHYWTEAGAWKDAARLAEAAQ